MSMKIDITNYEAYAADYLDGTLKGAALDAFKAFLLCNPEIASELEELAEADVALSAPEASAHFKDEMKIGITTRGAVNEENYESFFALSVGAQAGEDAYETVKEFLELNPAFQREHALYTHTALKPDTAIWFEDKAALKRAIPLFERVPVILYRVAAVLVLALGAYTAFRFAADATYKPRVAPADFAVQQTDSTPYNTGKPLQTAKENDAQQAVVIAEMTANPKRQDHIEPLPIRNVSLTPDPEIEANREMIAYEPVVPGMVPDGPSSVYGRSQELTLAQYLGKQIGIEPEQVPTTKALIREGVSKVIPHNDQFAIEGQSGDDNRNTFHILAGAFEFKRVTYKEN